MPKVASAIPDDVSDFLSEEQNVLSTSTFGWDVKQRSRAYTMSGTCYTFPTIMSSLNYM